MASTINGTSTDLGGLVTSGDDSGILQLQTNETTAVTIDASQNVGIGTSSPATKLHVAAAGGVAARVENTANSTNAVSYQLKNTSGGMYLGQDATGGYLLTDYSAPILFYTNNTERARIDSSGNLLVGLSSAVSSFVKTIQVQDASSAGFVSSITGANARNWVTGTNSSGLYSVYDATAAAYRFQIDSNGNAGFGRQGNGYGKLAILFDPTAPANSFCGLSIDPTSATSGAKFVQFYNEAGSGVGSISRNGTTNAVLYNTSSDYRLKENPTPLTGALARVAALKPMQWVWKDCDGATGEGFIAHEVQEVVAGAVSGEKDAVDENGKPQYQGMDASYLVATLTAAIQEQQALITTLTERITALEGATQ